MSKVTDTTFMDVWSRKQEQLSFSWGENGETSITHDDGSRASAIHSESPPLLTNLMEEIVDRRNMLLALRRVIGNKGNAGVDGMSVDELTTYLKSNWSAIKELLLEGRYQPNPVKRVDIPKPGGGIRSLGIPTVLDRLIQQSISQVLTPIYDPTFSDFSYGFRPNRSAHHALEMARKYVEEGYRIVVDMDIEKFFDRVNHNKLMSLLAVRIGDKRLLKLIRRFLQSGMMFNGLVEARSDGTPQGGPLSPLLSNILLNELDKELTGRGHRFCRYADDCNVYVKSMRAGHRVIASLSRWLKSQLFLHVNMKKSGVAPCHKRKFLGMRVVSVRKEKVIAIAPESLKRVKDKIRVITRRNRGISLKQMLDELNTAMTGWVNYYRIAAIKSHLTALDEWIRHRVRCFIWKQWKTWRNRVKQLLHLGIEPYLAYSTVKSNNGLWAMSKSTALNFALTNTKLAEYGLKSLLERYLLVNAC